MASIGPSFAISADALALAVRIQLLSPLAQSMLGHLVDELQPGSVLETPSPPPALVPAVLRLVPHKG